MKPYPTLSEMGVESPKQIDNYYVTSINFVDVLRIVYDRPKTSILPSSRTYKFPRVQAEVGDDSKDASGLKTHPKPLAALEEVEKIMEAKSSKQSIAAAIICEIELLEEDIALRAECLKVLASKIPAVD